MSSDQSRPVSRAFMSRLREVLTARLPADPRWVVWVDGVVEELADVTPAQDIDRDALIAALKKALHANGVTLQAPAGTIEGTLWDVADSALALVRPAAGIVLSPEERDLNRRIVVRMAGFARAGSVLEFDPDAVGKLADRLEASS